jgi:predicted GNAT family N-acyltransferase
VHYEIKHPQTDDEFRRYFHFRWKILRAPWQQPEGSEIDDIEARCFHVMAVDLENNIIGVARMQFNSAIEAQIRYMAVAEKHERKGIGGAMIKAMESHAVASNHSTIMLDAREPAVGFYEKLGYTVTQKSYLLFEEIQHFRMVKNL